MVSRTQGRTAMVLQKSLLMSTVGVGAIVQKVGHLPCMRSTWLWSLVAPSMVPESLQEQFLSREPGVHPEHHQVWCGQNNYKTTQKHSRFTPFTCLFPYSRINLFLPPLSVNKQKFSKKPDSQFPFDSLSVSDLSPGFVYNFILNTKSHRRNSGGSLG